MWDLNYACWPVFSTSLRSISFPIFVASGKRGLKYSWIIVNRFRYDSKSENDTHSAHPCNIRKGVKGTTLAAKVNSMSSLRKVLS